MKKQNIIIIGIFFLAFFSVRDVWTEPPLINGNVITVTTADSATQAYTKIESAQSGDIVEIAPGTYKFRVYLSNAGTSSNPVIIRAKDLNNPPVFDSNNVDPGTLPGTFDGGDKSRALWQISGNWYEISGIIFKNAHISSGSSAGLRMRGGSNITVKDSIFEYNDNGVQGWGENILYENCIFRYNGALPTYSSPDLGHNIYTHGGTQTFRFCHIHDPQGKTNGQNIHLRGKQFDFEYCVIENEGTYMGDLMTSSIDHNGELHSMLNILGSLIIQKPNGGVSKWFTLYNSDPMDNQDYEINLYYNTLIGNDQVSEVVQFTDSGLRTQKAKLYNNIIYKNKRVFQFDTTSGVTAETKNNWWSGSASDYSAYASYMSDSIFGANPGFNNPANKDYTLTENAAVINKANSTFGKIPEYEIYSDANGKLRHKARSSAKDLGAFEYARSTSNFLPPAAPSGLKIR